MIMTIIFPLVHLILPGKFIFYSMIFQKGINSFQIISYTPGGSIKRNPTLRTYEKGFEFMPKFAKQIGCKADDYSMYLPWADMFCQS